MLGQVYSCKALSQFPSVCVCLPLFLLLFHPAFKPSFHSSHVIRTCLSCLCLTLLKSLFILELNCLPDVIRSFPRVQTLWSASVCLPPHTRPHTHTHTTSLLRAECGSLLLNTGTHHTLKLPVSLMSGQIAQVS